MSVLNRYSYDNSFPRSAYLVYNKKDQRFFVPLKKSSLSGRIAGPLAELSLRQTFMFSEEECQETVEAVYNFPLPGDAALDQVTVRFGKVKISTRLMDREEAEADYQEAKKKGRQAAILTRESPDVFALRVAGIRPGEKVQVTTSFFALGEQRGTGFEFRIPLTIAPRYSRSDERGPKVNGGPLVSMIDPQHRFSMDLEVPGSGWLRCLSFAADVKDGRMLLDDLVPDRDLVLRWEPERSDGIKALVLDDGKKNFAVVVTPPEVPGKLRGREIILMLDRSGSMLGAKWEATTWTAERFLDNLLPDDRFNLCLFHNESYWLDRHAVLATENNKQRAREMLRRTDYGGTELGMALEQAMDQPSVDDNLVKHVLVVTDAEVSDEDRIIQTVEGRDRMCSVICIDSAPNSHLAREMARAGRGVARFLTSDPDEKDIATSLDEMMDIFASPLMDWVSIVTDQPASDPMMGEYQKVNGVYGTAENLIPKGRNLMFLGHFSRKRGSFVDVWTGGKDGGGKVPVEVVHVPGKALSQLYWAISINRIEQLMGSERRTEEIVGILSAMGVPVKLSTDAKVYRENRLNEMRGKLREKLVEISLKHGVVCSETAFMASRKDERGRVTMVAPVPNALPQGWNEAFAPMSSPNVHGTLASLAAPTMADNALYSMTIVDSANIDKGLQCEKTLFDGVPLAEQGRIVLYDSLHDPDMPIGLVKTLRVKVEGVPTGKLLLFVRDPVAPRVILDLEQADESEIVRPVNIAIREGDRVWLELIDVSDGTTVLRIVLE